MSSEDSAQEAIIEEMVASGWFGDMIWAEYGGRSTGSLMSNNARRLGQEDRVNIRQSRK